MEPFGCRVRVREYIIAWEHHRMRIFTITYLSGLSLAITLAGCGGSSSSTDDNQLSPVSAATPITAVGQITGFGSVYVNGVEYDTTGANYDVDDAAASGDDDLDVGMVVKIQGAVNADGLTGQANNISYDDDVEGMVENLATDIDDANIKTFMVMGISVRADKNSTNFEGEDDPTFGFDTIMNGDNVEVSGDFSGDILIASYIEKQDASDDDFEARGTVDQYDGSNQFVLVLRNDWTLNVTIDGGAEIPFSGVMDGQYVEVEGTIPDPVNAPDSILATKIELEYYDRISDSDEDDVEIKGVLSYDMDAGIWSVLDVRLSFDGNTEYSPADLSGQIDDLSADGLYVEVEGQYMNEVLQVHEIELEEDDLEFKADVDRVTSTDARAGTVTLSFGSAAGTVDVVVTPDTMFLDDEAADHYDLTSIMAGDKVEIEARIADDGMYYASNLNAEDDAGYEIEGPLDAIDDVSITVLGVTFTVDMDTVFENGIPSVGNYVEVEDNDSDGTADIVEVED